MKFDKPRVYLDHAATTPLLPEVKELIRDGLDWYYNPSSVNQYSQQIRKMVEDARGVIADTLSVSPEEIFFTSGGSEGNNWITKAWISTRDHTLITSAVEHASILSIAQDPKYATRALICPVTPVGTLDERVLAQLLKMSLWSLLCVQGANNETGVVMPVRKYANIVHEDGGYIFSDCVQLYPHRRINPKELNLDALSASAHKFGGPKGVGFVYVSLEAQDNFVNEFKLIHGGGQEHGMRGGTENVVSILAMAKAAEVTMKQMSANELHNRMLLERMLGRLRTEIPQEYMNYNSWFRSEDLDSCLNVSFIGVDSQDLMALLDQDGIVVSAGSACHAGSETPSHVLKAMGASDKEANSAIRFTFGAENTIEDIDYVVERIKAHTEMLRALG